MKLAMAGAAVLWLQAALLGAGRASPGGGGGDDLLFDELAQRWLQRNGIQAPGTPVGGWPGLLERRFARLALGVFDVYVPSAALRDGQALKDASAGLVALLDAQHGFSAWVAGEPATRRKDDVLSRWLRSLGQRSFSPGTAAGADLAELAGADEDVRAALAALRTEIRGGKPLGVEHELSGVRIALFPLRGEFVEFVCVAGALDARLKPSAWSEGLHTWLEYQADDTRFLTLEYGASEPGKAPARGESVGGRNPAALGQLVAQVATRALFARLYPGGLDPALGSAMANALVIDLYGELDTRIDGDVRTRSSQGRSVFVPGGNPDGGALPATSAENRWRGTKGKDHFVGVLAQVQKQSGKRGATRPEKLTRFELVADDGSRRELVQAPFLGPSAVRPGPELLPDYLELLRCYGVAFLHWLRLEGAGKPAASAARFGEFLRALGRGDSATAPPRVLQELYGQPLSAAAAEELFDTPTLEGRFLAWLSKRG